MNFNEGGRRLNAMVGPEGEEHWSFAGYKSITPKTNLTYRDGFCDSEGNINQDMPQSECNVDFIESHGQTTVNVKIQHEKLSDIEKIIEMGFKEGITATLEQLAEILSAKSN